MKYITFTISIVLLLSACTPQTQPPVEQQPTTSQTPKIVLLPKGEMLVTTH
ncbi:hypothetical protein KBD59_00845 [Candidatus Gracilibacteria bacterium]|nr:hypothetical protein [Candidatus Gracilibacteria bacterium]